MCGPSTYGLVRDLLAPAAPTEKTFEELVALVQEHQQPTPSPIVERYTFFTRVQHSGETINDYVAQLRKIAKHCQFGETLNDMLRDRIVCGCRDKKLQYKLLADPALTFDSALAVAKASELADRGTRNLSGQDASVNRLLDNRRHKPPLPREKPPSIGPTQPCFRCGAAHPATTCKFRTSTCHYCKKQGHISKVCRKRTRDSKADKTASRSTNQLIGSNDDDEEDTDEYSLFYSSAGRTQPITVPVTLNGLDTTMEIDTGAALSVMNEHTYRSLWPKRKPPLKPTSIRLKTYTGEHIVVKGIIRVHVLYQAQQAELDLLVVAGKGPSLLGRDWLENLRLDWQSIKYSTTVADDLQEILDKHSTVFGIWDPGISKMKSLARCFVWWPGMDKALKEKVKLCDACQRTRKLPPVAPIQPWEWPERPWARLHIDYAGPLLGHMFLVVVDAHSKWMEVKAVRHATTATTLTELRSIFATHGIPELLVSDNGSVFTSVEFKDFVKTQGIRHTTSAPYHPATNGLAERAVQTFKAYMKKAPDAPLRDNLSQFLFQYRMTPHSTTGISPSELLLNRRPRSKLDLAIPNLTQKVRAKQLKQKIGHDQHAVARKFDVGDNVYVCDLPSKKDWVPGTIESTAGPLSFNVTLMTGQTFRRHADHLRPRSTVEQQPLTDWTDIPELDHDTETPDSNSEQLPPPPTGSTLATPSVRRSARATTAPDYLVDHY